MIRTQVLKRFLEEERARKEGVKEMSGEERWRRVGMSGVIERKEVKEMILWNTSHGDHKYLLSARRGDGS